MYHLPGVIYAYMSKYTASGANATGHNLARDSHNAFNERDRGELQTSDDNTSDMRAGESVCVCVALDVVLGPFSCGCSLGLKRTIAEPTTDHLRPLSTH